MKMTIRNLLCRLMVVALMMLPFQTGQAGMIGTDQVIAVSGAQADRNTVMRVLGRAETISQFQSLGLDSGTAAERVAAMTDDEIRTLAGNINAAPAGADGGLALLVLVIFFVWYFAFRR